MTNPTTYRRMTVTSISFDELADVADEQMAFVQLVDEGGERHQTHVHVNMARKVRLMDVVLVPVVMARVLKPMLKAIDWDRLAKDGDDG